VGEWWNSLALADLTTEQWEALCDGCARCCLLKLQDARDGEIYYTSVRCRYLVEESCRCSDYHNRSRLVPNCMRLSPEAMAELEWLPSTCAYRLRAEGKPLPHWHPLVSGDPGSVHRNGLSVRGRTISEEHVHPDCYEEYIVTWID
jgi:uncharacterized cysteine cluster protein YcgN (CxxCxxCC family)